MANLVESWPGLKWGRGEAENCNASWLAARDGQLSPHQYSGHITAESTRE